jgi:transposase-like protein
MDAGHPMSKPKADFYEPDTPAVACPKCESTMTMEKKGPTRTNTHDLVFQVRWTCENKKCEHQLVRIVPARKKVT